MEYRLNFWFEKPRHNNLSLVREFYANMRKEPWIHVVTVRGVEVNISPIAINGVLNTIDVLVGTFNDLQLHQPYRAIRHTLAGVNFTTKWIRYAYKGYH